MTLAISFQPIPILFDSHDTQGQLVLAGGQLVAVLARLDGEAHDLAMRGQWHAEAGFGPCQGVGGTIYRSLGEASADVTRRLVAKQAEAV